MAQVRAFRNAFLGVLILTVSAAVAAAIYYSRKLAMPLRQLMTATTEIARGNFDVRPKARTHDEIEELAQAIQKMAGELKQSQQELVERERLAAMGEMTAEISHELQNRLGGIGLWLQHLDLEISRDDPRREMVDELKRGVRQFEGMLFRLKEYYRRPVLELQDICPRELIDAAIENTRLAAEKKKIAFETCGEAFPSLRGDRQKLESVLVNLLQNAVDASPGGEVILVMSSAGLEGDRSAIRIAVTDKGCGMAEEEQRKVFLPFYSTKSYGSGLGLAIASKYVKAHGGKLQVHSLPHHGATFTVVLPLVPPVNSVEEFPGP